jgi:crossover junction endodeoxyribonuclease RuvC
VIEKHGAALGYIASGVIRIPDGELAPRLRTIHEGITEVIDTWKPDLASVEIVFVNINPQTTLALGQARGAAVAALAIRDLPVHEYTALQVKQSVVGYGRAGKEQVQAMVRRLLQLPGDPSADAADALACAICHAHIAPLTEKLSQMNYQARTSRGRTRVRAGRLLG